MPVHYAPKFAAIFVAYPNQITKDCNFVPGPTRSAGIPFRLRWLALAGVFAVLGVMAAGNDAPRASLAASHWSELALPSTELADTEQPAPASAPPSFAHTVESGDTLSAIFELAGFTPNELYALTSLRSPPLATLHIGYRFEFHADREGKLQRLVLHQSDTRHAVYTREGSGFAWEQHEADIEVRLAYAHAVVRDSLFLAGRRAGLSDGLIMDLAYIFGWDIDFALDVRKGDDFTVVYEKLYRGDEFLRVGDILAAEFVNQGRAFRAARYTPADGRADYFTPEGHAMRKAFLRSPLNFSRISSRFTGKRLHPKLNEMRAHRGVDYAAQRGTPVWSTGDGKIQLRGVKGGYGKTVIVRHGTRYSTLYAHLNSFAKGMRTGTRVKQGQVIGFVGSTGLATGPHLHYEFRVNGKHRDPLRVKLPGAKPLPQTELAGFRGQVAQHWQQLDVLRRTQVALAGD